MVKTLTLLAFLLGSAHSHEAPLEVASSALQKDRPIPTQYTCRGRNISIPLRWRHVPSGTRSLAVVLTNETVGEPLRYLWAMYNIPPRQKWLKPNASLMHGERYAINSWGHVNYDGPCPSHGEHYYVLRIYALKKRFRFVKTIHAAALIDAMHNHIIATAKLSGWYS